MVLKLREPAPGNWQKAKCLNLGVNSSNDPFFDDDPQPALDYCNGDADGAVCPIRHECLLFALVNNCKEGVWGGCDELTRKGIRRKWPMQNRQGPRPEWKWMDRDSAVAGLDVARLKRELEEGTG